MEWESAQRYIFSGSEQKQLKILSVQPLRGFYNQAYIKNRDVLTQMPP